MTPTFEVTTYQEELDRIVEDVLNVMFSSSSFGAPPAKILDGFTASVSFTGEWRGSVLVRTGISTGKMLAQRLLKLKEVSAEDVADAMGELANMIGGNLKSVLPPGVLLSVPMVALGNELAVRVCGRNETSSTCYSCDAGHIEVILVHSTY